MINFSTFKNRQWYVLGGLLTCLLILCLIFWAISMRDMPTTPQKTLKSSMVTGASRTNPQEAWVYQFKSEAELANKRLNALEEMLAKLLKMNESAKALKEGLSSRYTPNSPSKAGESDTVAPVELIGSVREDLKIRQNNDQTLPVPSGQMLPPPPQNSPPETQAVVSFPHEIGGPLSPSNIAKII